MDEHIRAQFKNLASPDAQVQNQAYTELMAATEGYVPWAYEVWDALVAGLTDPNNRVRSISSQLLCNLARRSDPQGRILRDFDALLHVTRDERYVTARHCLQSIWKVGAAGEAQRHLLLEALQKRFVESAGEKNSTLIRYDIVEVLHHLYQSSGDEAVKRAALRWIATETDPKYRKKYESVWKERHGLTAGLDG